MQTPTHGGDKIDDTSFYLISIHKFSGTFPLVRIEVDQIQYHNVRRNDHLGS